MQIIATHNLADFDALASMVAATFLYPGAMGALPTQLSRNVDEFLALHRDLFRICTVKDLDLSGVTSLVVVDTNHWSRLGPLEALRQRQDLEVFLWDHHMGGENIQATWKCHEESGATITLLLREMRRRDTAFTPIHATLFLIALYEDTGSLSYPSTTPEDAYTAGFLLENGADLNVAQAYLVESFDSDHTDVLAKMLEESEIRQVAGLELGISLFQVDRGLNMLSSVVSQYRSLKGMDAVFALFEIGPGRCLVIGRSGPQGVNVGALMRRLGGGGHPGAGSALVKSKDPELLRSEITQWAIDEMNRPKASIRDIMSSASMGISQDTSIAEARSILEKGPARTLAVVQGDEFCGLISMADCAKAKTDAQNRYPVKAFMKREIPLLHPDQSPREALRLMAQYDLGLLPVVEDGRMIGVVTRGDLVLQLYDF